MGQASEPHRTTGAPCSAHQLSLCMWVNCTHIHVLPCAYTQASGLSATRRSHLPRQHLYASEGAMMSLRLYYVSCAPCILGLSTYSSSSHRQVPMHSSCIVVIALSASAQQNISALHRHCIGTESALQDVTQCSHAHDSLRSQSASLVLPECNHAPIYFDTCAKPCLSMSAMSLCHKQKR